MYEFEFPPKDCRKYYCTRLNRVLRRKYKRRLVDRCKFRFFLKIKFKNHVFSNKKCRKIQIIDKKYIKKLNNRKKYGSFVPDRRIRMRRYPNTGESVGENFILQKLSPSIFVNVNATRLAVMYFATNYSRISALFHFNT